MFNDLLTSAKGPGVIGIVLALVVLMGFGGLAALVLDGDGGGQSIDSQIQEREAHIQRLNGRKAEWQGKVEDYAGKKKIILEIDSIESKIQQKQKLSAAATYSVREASDRVAAVEKQFQDYKQSYRISERSRAVGEKVDRLTLENGKVYTDVMIRRVSAEGIDIRHKNGGTLIVPSLIPDDLLDRFQYTEEDTNLAAKQQNAREQASLKGSAAYAKALKANDFKDKINKHKADINRIKREIVKARNDIKSYQASASRASAKASVHRGKASAARAAGRVSSQGALAKQESEKAAEYRKFASNRSTFIRSKEAELSKIERTIRSLEKELQKFISK